MAHDSSPLMSFVMGAYKMKSAAQGILIREKGRHTRLLPSKDILCTTDVEVVREGGLCLLEGLSSSRAFHDAFCGLPIHGHCRLQVSY